jgi:hypothetical protein
MQKPDGRILFQQFHSGLFPVFYLEEHILTNETRRRDQEPCQTARLD